MAKFQASVVIDRPVEEVWKAITDLSKLPKWDTSFLEARQTSAGPMGVGTTFVASVRRLHANFAWSGGVIEYEANRKFSLEWTSGPAKGTIGIWSVENIEGKTRVTQIIDPKLSGFWKLIGPFMTGQVKRSTEASVGNMKRILESQTQS